VRDLWQRIEAWGRAAGAGSLRLRPPALEDEIRRAEEVMGLVFPEDLRASLLCHDGEEPDPDFEWLPGCAPLQPLQALVARWTEARGWAEADPNADPDEGESEDGRHRLCLWHPRRIPIAGSPFWDGDNTYVDLAPGSRGTEGQILTFTSECDLEVLGPSFRATLEKYVCLLERGELVWSASDSRVVPADGRWNGHAAEVFARMIA